MKDVYILGDTHGHYHRFFQDLDRLDIRDSLVIHVGDMGIGFGPVEGVFNKLKKMNDLLKRRNVEMIGIRGNHDDPEYFNVNKAEYSHFKLLSDYSTRTINGQKFLFVGGAISVDRFYRTEGLDYWKNEGFVLDEERAKPCDVLITHTGPNWIGPSSQNGFVVPFFANDPTLEEELAVERGKMQRLFELTQPTQWALGHFHQRQLIYKNNCWCRILDINELVLLDDFSNGGSGKP